MLDSNLFERVLLEPAKNANRLVIVSGYASAGMAERHLQELSNLQITLTVGMVRQGINTVQHQAFKKISADSPFVCKYWGGNQPIHAKVYAWSKDDSPTVAFAGSANYTNNGFSNRQKEVLTEVDADKAMHWCNSVVSNDCAYLCTYEGVANHIPIIRVEKQQKLVTPELESHTLPLYIEKKRETHSKAGLNWGQRGTRNRNEAYIPIPSELQYRNSDFFPPPTHHFAAITDDGYSMILVVAQQNGKALQTPRDNAELGRYFRLRLGLASGEYIRYGHLQRYGRTHVTFEKIDNETYRLDFSPEAGKQGGETRLPDFEA